MAAPCSSRSRPASRQSHRGATTGTALHRGDAAPVLLSSTVSAVVDAAPCSSEVCRPLAAAADRARSRLKILRGGAAAVSIEEVIRARAWLNRAPARLNRAQARWWSKPRARVVEHDAGDGTI